ncbi:MAG: hypothetical protein ACLFVJ_02975 [Persicimonas sp.]
MRLGVHQIVVKLAAAAIATACLTVASALLLPRAANAEPPQFGIEVDAGTGIGLTSYLRNEVRTEVDRTRTDEQGRFLLRPFLADRDTGQATSVAARLVASNIVAGLSLRWFDLPSDEIHHEGNQLISQNRRRPDGSVDDSGVDYRRIDPPSEELITEDDRNTLLVFGLDAEYRFIWPTEAVDIFVPVGGGLVLTHVNRDAAPYRLGLQASSGIGVSVEFLSGISLVLSGRAHALATTHYGRRDDSARRSSNIGESTEAAYFSTLVYATGNLGLQFRIR